MSATCTRKYQSVAQKLIATPDVRLVSQVFCNERKPSDSLYGVIVTYTSKNELITFAITTSTVNGQTVYNTQTLEE